MYLIYFAVIRLRLNLYKVMNIGLSLINNIHLGRQVYSLSCVSMNIISMIKGVLTIIEGGV